MMGDSELQKHLDFVVRALEVQAGRALTVLERQSILDGLSMGPYKEWMRAWVERQGTNLPDFDALYRRKAELDGES